MFELQSTEGGQRDVPAPSVGVVTAVRLAGVNVTRASESALVDTVVAAQDLIAWATSIQLQALAELDAATDADGTDADAAGRLPVRGWESHQRGDRKRSIATELGLVLKIPAPYAYDRLSTARVLVAYAPAAVQLLGAARLSPIQARDLADALISLPDDPEHPGRPDGAAVATVLDRVLAGAVDQSSGQFRARLARAVMAAAPRQAEVLHAAAVADRTVVTRREDHGVGTVWARIAAPDLLRVQAAINDRAAEYLRGDPADDRTPNQRRADAFVDLITTNATHLTGTGSTSGARLSTAGTTTTCATVAGMNPASPIASGTVASGTKAAERAAAKRAGANRD